MTIAKKIWIFFCLVFQKVPTTTHFFDSRFAKRRERIKLQRAGGLTKCIVEAADTRRAGIFAKLSRGFIRGSDLFSRNIAFPFTRHDGYNVLGDFSRPLASEEILLTISSQRSGQIKEYRAPRRRNGHIVTTFELKIRGISLQSQTENRERGRDPLPRLSFENCSFALFGVRE